ncbi:MAG: YwhD family protein [Alicyclobacillaceae bacterium]|nr:YwhD family protein [Alicyclobacillaceae bacterium]
MEKLNLTGQSKHATDDAMRGLSAVLVDGDEVFVDNGAIHGKSRLERGIRFVQSREEVPHPRPVRGFWITLRRGQGGAQGYHGAAAFTLYIDSAAQVGYKSLSEQVNGMDKAVKGKVDVAGVPADVRRRVGLFLQQIRPELWDNASDEFRSAFIDPTSGEGTPVNP